MKRESRPPFSDRTAGKVVALVALSVATAWFFGRESENQDPFWLNVFAAAVLVFGLVGAYELLGSLVGRGIARTPLGATRREARHAGRVGASGGEPAFRAREALTLLGAFIAAQVLVWVVIAVIATGGGADLDGNRLASLAGSGIVAALLAGGVAVSVLFMRYTRASTAEVPLSVLIGLRGAPLGQLALAGIAGVVIASGLLFLRAHVPVGEDVTLGALARAAQTPGWSRIGWIVGALVLAPPIEEFLFRGALFEGLRRSWGLWLSGTAVTVLFVALHLPELWHYWPAVLGLTLAAVTMLITRLRSGSLGPPVAVHFFYNLTIVGAVLMAG
jgi:membrane protease YdiL (CAAX protease family)